MNKTWIHTGRPTAKRPVLIIRMMMIIR